MSCQHGPKLNRSGNLPQTQVGFFFFFSYGAGNNTFERPLDPGVECENYNNLQNFLKDHVVKFPSTVWISAGVDVRKFDGQSKQFHLDHL